MMYKDNYLSYLRFERRYSHHTVEAYDKDLQQYYAFCSDNKIESDYPDSKTVRLWIVNLLESEHAPRSVNRKISTLRGYIKFLIKEGKLHSDPLNRIIKPKTSQRNPIFITEDRLNDILDTYQFGDDFEGWRNRLIVEMLYQTGIRRAELISLKLKSCDPANKYIRIIGKRSKERIIPLGDNMIELFNRYIEERNKKFPGLEEDSLLLTGKGIPVYPKMVYRVVHEFLNLVTSLDKRSPHVLRH